MWYVVTFDFKHSYKVWAHSEQVAISLSLRRLEAETGKRSYNHVGIGVYDLELA